ncbi:MAG TPA: ATP-binding protein [Agromyces sp.]|nr:ATP-binding protein [Agromyces sp.]
MSDHATPPPTVPPGGADGPDATGAEDSVALDRAREYAALSGPFDPVQALQPAEAGPTDATALTVVAAGLSHDCDKVMRPSGVAVAWLMRGITRRRVLDRLAEQGGLADAVTRRRATATDDATRDLLDAIDARGLFTTERIEAAIAAADRPALERLAIGLGRADGHTPLQEQYPRVKAALTRLELLGTAQAARGGVRPDHEEELERIIGWLDTGFVEGRPTTLYIEGLRGAGKSALIEEVAARLLVRDDEWVVVRFDFDRAGLDVQDTVGLTMELARQVATQLPGEEAAIQQARQRAAGTTPGTSPLKGDSPERVPEELGLVLRRALAQPQRRILMVLDDLELLRGRGATHPARLFEWLDELAEVAHAPIAVVGAGRGDALRSVHARIGERIELPGLDDAGADRELERLGVDPAARDAVRAIAAGDPLTLRLAAQVVTAHGPDALLRAAGRGGMTATYLYRVLLSRIHDPDLRRIGNAALIVRRVDAGVIREVVGPRSGLRGLTPERAAELHDELARLDWLMEPDPVAAGVIRPRTDLRAAVLPLLYESAPTKSAAIDRDAARWFGERTEPWAAAEAAYHLLQLMRHRPEPPEIAPATLARIDAEAIAELPPAAQDLVRRSRRDRTRSHPDDGDDRARAPRRRGAATAPGPDDAAVRELRSANERSDWPEGDHLFDRAFARSALDPGSTAADTALTFLWRAGRWTEARLLLDQRGGWRQAEPPIDEQLTRTRLDTICRLEMGAETAFDAVVEALRHDEALRTSMAKIASESMLASLVGAGLRFALHRAGVPIAPKRTTGDPVDAAIRLWAPEEAVAPRSRDREQPDPPASVVAAGWECIVARAGSIDPATMDPAAALARSAAVLTPFTDLVDTMSRLRTHAYLSGYAAGTRPRLDALGFLAPSGSEPWHDRVTTGPALALRSLADLGLLAEFVGAAAYLRRDRDLRLVAAAAERWRRTIAGAWAYGTRARPPGWDRALDVTVADRLAVLLDATDPAALARAHLEAWAPEHAGADEVLRLIRERSPATVAAATRAAEERGAGAAASLLIRRGLPSAFVPAVAMLVAAARPGRTAEPTHRPT